MTGQGLARELQEIFGLGKEPQTSARLYARLEREVQANGAPALEIILAVADHAPEKQDPGVWFRGVVRARLIAAGMYGQGPLTLERQALQRRLRKLRESFADRCRGPVLADEDRKSAAVPAEPGPIGQQPSENTGLSLKEQWLQRRRQMYKRA
jgi:hypothetical protein